jgi:hypothetical protein
MAPIPYDTFRRRFRSLSRAQRTGFVAALWAARGVDTRVDEPGAITVTDPETGAVDRLYVLPRRRFCPGRAPVPDDVDAVVTTADDAELPPGLDGYRPADLRDMALYGIERAACRELFDRFFGLSPTDWPEPSTGASGGTGTGDGAGPIDAAGWRSRPVVPSLVALAVLVVLAVLAGATSGGSPLALVGSDSPSPDALDSGDRTATPTVTASPRTPSAGANATAGANPAYPPGLGPSGITDGYALAAAHAATADRRSYQLTLVHHEYVDGVPVVHGFEAARVEAPTVYVSTVGQSDGEFAGVRIVDDAARYADGTDEYVRQVGPDGPEYYRTAVPLRTPGQGRYGARIETYLGWFLSVDQSRIASTTGEGDETRYWISFRGDPWPGVTNTTGYAVVGADGFVYEVHRQHSLPGSPGRTVEVTVRYDQVGSTTVQPPWWLPEARNATGAGAAASTPAPGSPTVTATPESAHATPDRTPDVGDDGVREERHSER